MRSDSSAPHSARVTMTGAAAAARAGACEAGAGDRGGRPAGRAGDARDDAAVLGGVDGDEAHAGERRGSAATGPDGRDLHEARGTGPDGVGERGGRRALAGELERRLQPRAPGGAVEAGAKADGSGAARRRVAGDAGHGEAHAGVELDGRARAASRGPGDREATVPRGRERVQAGGRRADPGGGASRVGRPRRPRAARQARRSVVANARVRRGCRTVSARVMWTPVSRCRCSAAPETHAAGDVLARRGSRPCFNGVGAAPRSLEQEVGSCRLVGLPGRRNRRQSVPSSPPNGSPTRGRSGRSSR